jgi:hypothetical protein
LIDQLYQVWTSPEFSDRRHGRRVILIKEGEAYDVSLHEEIAELRSNQEETDSRVVLYCHFAASQGYDFIKVRSPDSDIFWILLSHASQINCEILFDTGHGDKKRLISISKLADHYGSPQCSALLGLHSFTGCDSVSAFKGKGKVSAAKLLGKSPSFSKTFQQLGSSWVIGEELVHGLEKFVCALYGKPKFQNIDALRHFLLKSKCHSDGDDLTVKVNTNIDLSGMPPSRKCLIEHIKRANYQARIWRMGDIPISDLPKPWENHGWLESGEPCWCPPDFIVPKSLVDILENVGDDSEDLEEEEQISDFASDESDDDDDSDD